MKKKRLIWWGGALAVLVASAVMGYTMARNAPSVLRDEEALTTEERLSVEAQVEIEYSYSLCGHKEKMRAASGDFAGLSRAEVRERGFGIREFSAGAARFSRAVDQYCAEHYILMERDGKLCLLQNTDRSDMLSVVKVYDDRLDKFTENDRQRLRMGIVFSSMNDVLKFRLNG